MEPRRANPFLTDEFVGLATAELEKFAVSCEERCERGDAEGLAQARVASMFAGCAIDKILEAWRTKGAAELPEKLNIDVISTILDFAGYPAKRSKMHVFFPAKVLNRIRKRWERLGMGRAMKRTADCMDKAERFVTQHILQNLTATSHMIDYPLEDLKEEPDLWYRVQARTVLGKNAIFKKLVARLTTAGYSTDNSYSLQGPISFRVSTNPEKKK